MNLFKKLAEGFKVQNRERKAEEGIVPTVAITLPYIVTSVVNVPVGFVLPLGEPIQQSFNLTVEAGVRWHPEWEEPRICVNLWRLLPQGDALGWSGPKALDFKTLLDPDVAALATYHGQTVTPQSKALLDKMGLAAPKVQQLRSTFLMFRGGKA